MRNKKIKLTEVSDKKNGIGKFIYRYSYTLIAVGVIVAVVAGITCAVIIRHNYKQKASAADAVVSEEVTEAVTEAPEAVLLREQRETRRNEIATAIEGAYLNYRVVFDVNTDSESKSSALNELISSIQDSQDEISDVITESQLKTVNTIASTAQDSLDSLVYMDYKALNIVTEHILSGLLTADDYSALMDSLDAVPDFENYMTALNEKKAAEEAAARAAEEAAAAAAKAAEEAALSKLAEESSGATEEDEHANDDVSDGDDKVPMVLTSNMSFGVDVSHYQSDHGTIDWKKVKDSGITFAIIKCGGRSIGTDGKLYKDPAFEQNIVGALANGIQVGVYFFSQARTTKEAAAEADYCIKLIEKYKITYPVAFDWESGKNYRVNKTKISNSQLTSICTTFADKIAAAGYTPMIYFCKNDWLGRVDGKKLTGKYKTWLAYYFKDYYYTEKQWQPGDDGPEFDYNYDIWQYGVTNTVPGINYYTDMNVAMFSYDNYSIDLYEASLSVDSEVINVKYGKASSFLDKVHAINCLGVENSVSVTIDNKKYTETTKIDKISYGTHKVKVSFTDPIYGTFTKEFKVKVSSTVNAN